MGRNVPRRLVDRDQGVVIEDCRAGEQAEAIQLVDRVRPGPALVVAEDEALAVRPVLARIRAG